MTDQDNFTGNPFDDDNFAGDPFADAPKEKTFADAAKAHLAASEANRKDFASTPARMLKSTMQMIGAGDYVPEVVSKAAEVPEGGTVGRVVGDIAGTGGIKAGTGAIVNALRGLNAARGVAPMVGRLATASGTTAAASAITSPDDQADAAMTGAIAGPVGHALGRTIGGMVKPTAEARTLLDKGVPLTPGQAGGVGSWAHSLEQLGTSNPISGVPIRAAQGRALHEANRAAAQSVVDIVDSKVKLGLPPRDAIEQTRDTISKTYDQGLDGMSAPAVSAQSHLGLRLQDLPNEFPMVEDKQFEHMWRFVADRIGAAAQNNGGFFTGKMLKQLDSEIGQHAWNMATSTNAADKTAAPAWRQLQQSLREVMENGQPDPAKLAQLKSANNAYRQLLAVERALLPGAEAFTPRQLNRQLGKAKINAGELRKVSNAMSKTLPNTVPNSGTAERLLAQGLPAMLMGGGAGAQAMGWDTVGTGMLTAGALGTKTGSRLMTGTSRIPFSGGAHWQPAAEAAVRALRRGVRPEDDDK